jgi:hypothetical protein
LALVSKIFILNGLCRWDRVLSGQNLEPKGLTRKIFWNNELGPIVGLFRPSVFLGRLSRLFILKDLPRGYERAPTQNLELKGLIAKIFRNKDLA